MTDKREGFIFQYSTVISLEHPHKCPGRRCDCVIAYNGQSTAGQLIQVKNFHIWDSIIPLNIFVIANQMWSVCAFLYSIEDLILSS